MRWGVLRDRGPDGTVGGTKNKTAAKPSGKEKAGEKAATSLNKISEKAKVLSEKVKEASTPVHKKDDYILDQKIDRKLAENNLKALAKDRNLTRAGQKDARRTLKDLKNKETYELQNKIERLEKEKLYNKLTAGDKDARHAMVKDIASTAALIAVTKHATNKGKPAAASLLVTKVILNRGNLEKQVKEVTSYKEKKAMSANKKVTSG